MVWSYLYLLVLSIVPVQLDREYAFNKNFLSASMYLALDKHRGFRQEEKAGPVLEEFTRIANMYRELAFRKKPEITCSIAHFPLLSMSFSVTVL